MVIPSFVYASLCSGDICSHFSPDGLIVTFLFLGCQGSLSFCLRWPFGMSGCKPWVWRTAVSRSCVCGCSSRTCLFPNVTVVPETVDLKKGTIRCGLVDWLVTLVQAIGQFYCFWPWLGEELHQLSPPGYSWKRWRTGYTSS